MKFRFSFLSLTLASFTLTVFAQDQTPTPAPGAAPPVNAVDPAAARQVREILRMADKGVSEKTMLSHIYNSPGVALSGEDVTALHKRGLSITVITAMLEQQQRTQAGETLGTVPAETVASVALSTEPEPIIYPTPAREPVPLTSPEAVYLSPYVYGYSPVIITGGSFYGGGSSCYSGGFYGGCGSFGGGRSFSGGFYNYPAARSYGCGTSSYGYGSGRSYGCNSGPRGRF